MSLTMSSYAESISLTKETGFFCDVCDKPMTKNEDCWVLKQNAPIEYCARGFCLCDACHPGSLCHVDASLAQDSKSSGYECCANGISRCRAHDDEPSAVGTSSRFAEAKCTCRCAICDKAGHRGCEREWYVGSTALPPSQGWPDVAIQFRFVLCPDCVPSSVHDMGPKVAGEFSKKWFDPHLEKSTLQKKYFNV